jgi:hypothetical protein
MANIIDLAEKKKLEQARRLSQDRSRRMNLVLQVFQCSKCALKCTKCGGQLEARTTEPQSPSTPYRLCESCFEEYEEFLERLHSRGNPEFYFYNQEWMDVWKAWMNYQDALNRYGLSEGFQKLVEDMKES